MLSYRNLIFAFSSLLILSYLIYKLIIPLDETINFQFLIFNFKLINNFFTIIITILDWIYINR